MTAAHCIGSIRYVYIGYSKPSLTRSADLPNGTWQTFGVKKDAKHPSWAGENGCPMTGVDVALLQLDGHVSNVESIRLADHTPIVGDTCIVAGYGRHNVANDLNEIEANLTNISRNERREATVRIASIDGYNAFSAKGIDGAHAQGDSGGSLLCGEKLAGVVSCTPDRNQKVLNLRKVYADIQSSKAFVEETLRAWDAESPPPPPPPPECGLPNCFRISEYYEGLHADKAIEIENRCTTAIDLSKATLNIERNASTTGTALNGVLTGTLAPGSTYVVCSPALATTVSCSATSGSLSFNGNDRVFLTLDGQVVDSFGQLGVDPGNVWTDSDFRRKTACDAYSGQGEFPLTSLYDKAADLGTSNLGVAP